MMQSLSFSSLIGQDKGKELLKRSADNRTMAHAYLLRGPDGVGKKRAALTMAAYINCRQPAGDVCGRCSSCKKYLAASHPDLMVIQPEGAGIKIDRIRELKQALNFPPFEAKYRVIVLEDVHTMRREAANSLLKTLEEPPPDNILILTADEAGELLPTITSRCQMIPFHALPYDEVAAALMARAEMDDETARTLAAVAEGSLGRALSLHENNLLPFRRELIESLLRLAPDEPETIPALFLLAEKAAGLKENLQELLELMKSWVRDLILFSVGCPAATVNQDLRQSLEIASKRWNLSELFAKLSLINKAERELLRNCNRALVCEVLLLGFQ